ncbi:hypothetical protein F4802DRAFT_593379 [Xylaria palmicola]|nr:hypothetical protein F4802DRAFT_593379 [Xylaria palmicola]
MSTTAPPSVPLRARVGGGKWLSKIYQVVVTPVNFVAFLVSLYLIDNYYRAQRYQQHGGRTNDGKGGRTWLHKFLYRRVSSPYEWVDGYRGQSSPQPINSTPRHNDEARRSAAGADGSWFYHTKQRKLLRAEVADAFALRNSVLFALGILAASTGWALWWAVAGLAAYLRGSEAAYGMPASS